jgi:DNA-binding CsgD family transcriptional regulator
MLLIADRPEPSVERALRFVTDALGSVGAAFYRIADDGCTPYDFVLHNIRYEFHRTYISEMIAHDPLNVSRLLAQSSAVVCLEEEGLKVNPSSFLTYRHFLGEFGLNESVEFVFKRDGESIAGMNVSWPDVRRRAHHQSSLLRTVQSYLEFNIARDLAAPVAEAFPSSGFNLTPREVEIAALLCVGQTNRDISESLNISLPTVKTHLAHIFDKMGAENRTMAVALLSTKKGSLVTPPQSRHSARHY